MTYTLPATVGIVSAAEVGVNVEERTVSFEAGLKGFVPAASSAPLEMPSPSSSRESQTGSLSCASVTP